MEKNEILTILVFFLILVSVLSPILFYSKIKDNIPSISAKASSSSGQTSLTVIPTCGDGDCETPWENCTSCELDCGVCVQLCGDLLCTGNETCETCPGDCGICGGGGDGGGGGGGGGTTAPVSQINFIFNPDVMQEKLFIGDSVNRIVTVTNIGIKSIVVYLDVVDLDSFVFLNKDVLLQLRADESDTFEALFSVSDSAVPGVYLGSIIGEAQKIQKTLPIVLTINEAGAPIFVSVTIPEDADEIFSGEGIQGDLSITNSIGDISVDITNSIRNWKEEEILSRSGQLDLSPGENLFTDEFDIPEESPPGYYLLYVNVYYNGKSYTDAAAFRIKPQIAFSKLFLGDYIFYLWLLFLAISLFLIIFFMRRLIANRKKGRFGAASKKKKKKEEEVVITSPELINQSIARINELKKKASVNYNYSLVERYFAVMRRFFSRYYNIKSSLTFEELVTRLAGKDIKRKKSVIAFINRIAHIPYYYTLIPKGKFILLLNNSITLLNTYKSEVEDNLERSKKDKKNLKKKK